MLSRKEKCKHHTEHTSVSSELLAGDFGYKGQCGRREGEREPTPHAFIDKTETTVFALLDETEIIVFALLEQTESQLLQATCSCLL